MKRRRLKVLHSAHDNSVSYLCIGNYDAAFTAKYLGVCIVSEIGQVSSYCNSDEKAGSYSSMEMSCWSNDNTDDILYYCSEFAIPIYADGYANTSPFRASIAYSHLP
ncbi:hypothetical protein AAG906_001113 [Vitis piasezkii]